MLIHRTFGAYRHYKSSNLLPVEYDPTLPHTCGGANLGSQSGFIQPDGVDNIVIVNVYFAEEVPASVRAMLALRMSMKSK
jgi:hypothetical protein